MGHSELSDGQLIQRVRDGDLDAYGVLFERHLGAARRLALHLARCAADLDDLVASAFAKVLTVLQAGRGPDSAFRAYLLTALRHTAYSQTRAERRLELTDDIAAFGDSASVDVSLDERTITREDCKIVACAFNDLPDRWKAVLRLAEIDGNSLREIASSFGVSSRAVSALAYRARNGLRAAYLEHLEMHGQRPCPSRSPVSRSTSSRLRSHG